MRVHECGVTGFNLQKGLTEYGVDCFIDVVPKMIGPAASKREKIDRDEAARSKRLLSKFLIGHGYVFDERTQTGRRKGKWLVAHLAWIKCLL